MSGVEASCKVENSKGIRCDREITFGQQDDVCSAHEKRMVQHGTYDADRPIRPYSKSGLNRVRPPIPGDTPEEKFWNQVEKLSTGHWRWTGATFTGDDVRGMHRYANNRTVGASRFSWELVNGTAPKGSRVRVACEQAGCLNPSHLELEGADIEMLVAA